MKDIASPMVLAISLGCVIRPLFSICFTGGLPPLLLILQTMSQHFFIDVLAFNFDTYSCQLFFLLARMTCLGLTLFIQYSCNLPLLEFFLKTSLSI